MALSDCAKEDGIKFGVIGTVSTKLEIGKLEVFGSTSGSMSGCTPPSTDDAVFSDISLDISPPSCQAHSNNTP